GNLSTPLRGADLDEHDVTTHGRVVHARSHPDEVLPTGLLGVHARATQEFPHLLLTDAHALRPPGGDATGRLAGQLPDFPLELPHARLTGVLRDHQTQCLGADAELVGLEPCLLTLAR